MILANTPPTYLEDFTEGEFFGGRNDETGGSTYGGKAMYAGPAGGGTDSIEIRGPLRSNVNFVTGELVATSTVDVIGTGSGFATDEYLMISDCAGADIFRATAVTTSGGNTQISHDTSYNSQSSLSRRYGADSVVMEFTTHTYFVADTGRNNAAGDDIYGLFRFDGASSVELVDGVDDLQVEYALDTDNDNVVDGFADPGGVTNWDEVMSVRISLLLNSVEGASPEEAPYTYFPAGSTQVSPTTGDYRLRQEFSAMISVRNSVL